MDRSEDEVSRLGGANRRLEGLLVPHFADEHDVRILADQGTQGLVEVQAVDADLSLVDAGLVVLEDVLDRILDRDDVTPLAHVHVLEHRCDRGALARPGDPGEQDESVRRQRHGPEDLGNVQLLERLDVGSDQSAGERDLAAALEDVHTKSAVFVVVVREVELPVPQEMGEL